MNVRHRPPPSRAARFAAVVGALVLPAACGFGPSVGEHLDQRAWTSFVVVDERGAPVSDATFHYLDRSRHVRRNGLIELQLREPIAGVVSADGKLDEPVLLHPGDDLDEVVMHDRDGPHGTRVAMHFGGDVMLGRRYQEPGRRGTAVADDPTSARDVVADLAPVAAASDLTVVNVETVIGDHAVEDAASGKRFLLQSPPIITDALQRMGVDAVTLGNNHAYDWGDPGIETTLDAFEPTGIVPVGGGSTRDEAVRGVLVPAADRLVGIVSATTVDGDFVNDQLPGRDDPMPTDTPEQERWQYEQRSFGFGEPDDLGYIAERDRRAGTVWRMFERRERVMDAAGAAELWTSLTEVYPELQDWVARRGHGGAAGYDRAAVAAEIARLREQGASTVIAQFHAGYQFSQRPSPATQRISHHAIDDGADFVVVHHPHVLQGFEWYDGRLIAHSLGNLVFDQDFHTTFPSMLVRLVIDDAGLVEARALPVLLDDYRPVPVTGPGAERIVRLLDVRSALPGLTGRVDGLRTGVLVTSGDDDRARPAAVRFDRNTGVVEPERDETRATVDLRAGERLPIPTCRSMRVDGLPDAVEYGVDRFGWGAVDDVAADWTRRHPTHWVLRSPGGDGPTLAPGRSGGDVDDAIRLVALSNRGGFARTVARIPTVEHHWWSAPGEPVDAAPTFTLELDARRTGGSDGTLRISAYHVSDTDPTSDPASTLVTQWEQPIGLTDHDEWQHLEIPLDRLTDEDHELPIDAVMISFHTPGARHQEFRFDNVRFMEWRTAPDTDLPMWQEVDALRSDEATTFAVSTSGCTD